MTRVLEKVERRLGEKLLLKGERCAGPKCALVRKGYPPGAHGKRRSRGPSEFGRLLREKQKVRFLYGLDDGAIRRYTKAAVSKPGVFSSNFWRMLERRLDNVVFRLGLTVSRREAKHFIGHGHITVNGKTVTTPSYQVKKGDIIRPKDSSLKSPRFAELDLRWKKLEAPSWLRLDKAQRAATVLEAPATEELETQFDVIKIKEFYSR